jgi:hypothetical protein
VLDELEKGIGSVHAKVNVLPSVDKDEVLDVPNPLRRSRAVA